MKFLTKVVPISKSVGDPFHRSTQWNMAKGKQGYLYCRYFDEDKGAYVCAIESTGYEGDFFLESDLIPYEEPKQQSLGNGRFIELTGNNGTKILINAMTVQMITSFDQGAFLGLSPGESQKVTESYETIKQLLTDKGLML